MRKTSKIIDKHNILLRNRTEVLLLYTTLMLCPLANPTHRPFIESDITIWAYPRSDEYVHAGIAYSCHQRLCATHPRQCTHVSLCLCYS